MSGPASHLAARMRNADGNLTARAGAAALRLNAAFQPFTPLKAEMAARGR